MLIGDKSVKWAIMREDDFCYKSVVRKCVLWGKEKTHLSFLLINAHQQYMIFCLLRFEYGSISFQNTIAAAPWCYIVSSFAIVFFIIWQIEGNHVNQFTFFRKWLYALIWKWDYHEIFIESYSITAKINVNKLDEW